MNFPLQCRQRPPFGKRKFSRYIELIGGVMSLDKKRGEFLMLKVEHKNPGTVSLLNLEGNLLIGETDSLRDVVHTLPANRSVILDLSHVNMIDAHGLGVLLQLREQAINRDMKFELINVSSHLREIFRTTRLDTVFQIRSGFVLLSFAANARGVRVAA